MNSNHYFFNSIYFSRASKLPSRLLVFVCLLFVANMALAAPVAVDDVRSVPINTSITLNPLANDSSPDDFAFTLVELATPENGTAQQNPDGSVYYTPEQNFVGADSFSYTIEDSQGERAIALITINVTQKPFPSFADDENSANLATVLQDVCERLQQSSDAELGAARNNLLTHCNNMRLLAESNPDGLNRVLNQVAPEETIAQMRIAADSNRAQTGAVSQRMQQLRTSGNSFSLNGVALNNSPTAGGGAGDDLVSRTGIFVNVQHDAATRKITDLENGYDYDANTLTLGADYRLSNTWVMGVALGLTQNDLEFKQQDGDLETDITSLVVFGSQQRGRLAWDIQLGYGQTAFSSRRNIFYDAGDVQMDEVLRGSTEGDQWLLNTQLQWEWNRQALNVYPFASVNYVQNDTKAYGEQGTSGLAMMFSDQSIRQLTLEAGAQATYAMNRNWGVLVPMLQMSVLHDTRQDLDPVTARFAYDPDMDNAFQLSYDASEQTYFQFGVGASAVFKRGISAFFQYQQLLGYDDLSAYQLQAGVRYEL
jgi:outer membrane autotransporter protein